MRNNIPTRRCFIAIRMSEAVILCVQELLLTLKTAGADVRWVGNESIHLTIKFLGELNEKQIEEVKRVIQEVVLSHSPFTFKVTGVGGFPTLQNPKVLWAGVTSSKELISLHKDIETALSGKGLEREIKDFTPHLTLGRIRSSSSLDQALSVLEKAGNRVFGKVEVSELVLMESHLLPSGAKHTNLFVARLGKG